MQFEIWLLIFVASTTIAGIFFFCKACGYIDEFAKMLKHKFIKND